MIIDQRRNTSKTTANIEIILIFQVQLGLKDYQDHQVGTFQTNKDIKELIFIISNHHCRDKF